MKFMIKNNNNNNEKTRYVLRKYLNSQNYCFVLKISLRE